ncbi:hypothetical protein [Halalkalibacter wakoensis]|uniref:hypothetical protein n=1 Tax=Halalkalibacter wakoensis TaxID=127891 RepID=UPI00068D2B1D|nr:hypothetical protein [Halalkalibacter wakoensis]
MSQKVNIGPSETSFLFYRMKGESLCGQEGGNKESSCPKREDLRTGKAEQSEKLSEERAPSDRKGGTKREAVRRERIFGQERRNKERSCPKRENLRTGKAEQSEKLSEERASSDRKGKTKQKAVRRERT